MKFPPRKIRILAALAVFMISALFTYGCSGKEVKTPPAEVKPVSRAFAAIEQLRKAYEAKSDSGLKAFTTDSGYQDVSGFFDEFDSVTLTFTPKWVDMDPSGTMTIDVAWDGVWTKDGKKDSEQGMAVFEMTGNPPKLNRVLKGNPFTYPH